MTYISKPYPKEGKEGEASKVPGFATECYLPLLEASHKIHMMKDFKLHAREHCQSDSKEARKWQVNYLGKG